MNERLNTLAGRIRCELGELQAVAERTRRIWAHAATDPDDFRVDATAINLHGFYSGVERVFELIADRLDGGTPSGPNWRRELLIQMASEIGSVRQPVVSPELFGRLDQLRGFRHVVRNAYTYVLDPRQIQLLMDDLPGTVHRLMQELEQFAQVLEDMARPE